MGIINLTPDSFYAKSRSLDIGRIVARAGKMIEEGADIIDLGAVSTQPGSQAPSISEEIDRMIGPLMAIRTSFPEVLLSVDTYRAEVLRHCLDARINLVNDISGGTMDDDFLDVVASSGLPYILMHMQGSPLTMQDHPQYDELVLDLLKFFDRKIHFLRQKGIDEIVIDPGFGFGKTVADNYELLRHLGSFKILDKPILIGLSRKSMIRKVLKCNADQALNGTTALHMMAIQNGANILRVHDVSEARQCVTLWEAYNSGIGAD